MSEYSKGQRVIDIIRRKRNLQIINYFDFYRLWKKKHKLNNALIVMGDSHCGFFAGNEVLQLKNIMKAPGESLNFYNDKLQNFCTLHLGQALAYNLNKYGSTTKIREKVDFVLKKIPFNKNARIMCSFGEIDLRVHVLKQAEKQNTNYEKIIDEIIDHYIEFLLYMKSKGYKMYCWGPPATQKDDADENPYLPRYGDEITRNKATEYFNKKLEEVCSENNIGFISIFKDLIDKNYKTKAEYISSDDLHLSQKAMILAMPKLKKAFGF